MASEYGCRETVQLLIHAGANKGATTGVRKYREGGTWALQKIFFTTHVQTKCVRFSFLVVRCLRRIIHARRVELIYLFVLSLQDI